jgi:hypothetical protein
VSFWLAGENLRFVDHVTDLNKDDIAGTWEIQGTLNNRLVEVDVLPDGTVVELEYQVSGVPRDMVRILRDRLRCGRILGRRRFTHGGRRTCTTRYSFLLRTPDSRPYGFWLSPGPSPTSQRALRLVSARRTRNLACPGSRYEQTPAGANRLSAEACCNAPAQRRLRRHSKS